jgi:sugar phosphate isomerase/epimerase
MEIKILSPLWGHEHLELTIFLDKIKAAGYDGIDTWIPASHADKVVLYNYLQQHEMYIVTHQHAASGSTFKKFKESFLANLHECAKPAPLLINSHTGKDYFTTQQNLELIDIAADFTAKTGIMVAHETHRGRFGYCPQMVVEFFEKRNDLLLTADLSHWVCVTESMLENFEDILSETIIRTRHVHARVGFEEGPQVPDPSAPEWQYALHNFLGWWDRIVAHNRQINREILTFTTEFGPVPYIPVMPFSGQPVANQFDVNCYMKDLLRHRYQKS